MINTKQPYGWKRLRRNSKNEMKNLLLIILMTSFVQICLSDTSSLSAVVVLTDSNFDEMTKNGKWLLDFYAPWCPHCKKLGPNMEEAGRMIVRDKIDFKFGLIDCTVEKTLASRYKIDGFPTLKYFVSGYAIDYESGREIMDLLNFARRASEPEVLNVDDLESFSQKQSVSFIYFGDEGEGFEVVKNVARIFQTTPDLRFGKSLNKEKLKKYSTEYKLPSLILLNDPPGKVEIYSGPFELDQLEKWVNYRKFPLLAKVTEYNWRPMINSRTFCVITAANPESDNKWYLDIMREVSIEYDRKYIFAWIDGKTHIRFISQFNLQLDDLPSFFVYNGVKGVHYINKTIEKNKKSIISFIENVENGKEEEKGPGSGIIAKLSYVISDFITQLIEHPYMAILFVIVFLFVLVVMLFLVLSDGEPKEPKEKGE